MRVNRGDFNTPGTDSPFRARTPAENLARCSARCATAGTPTAPWCCAPRSTWPRPTSTCATRRSTASSAPRTTTPATAGASTRCTPIAHPIEDALENITHSICTLEFEDQRPFYDWLLDTLRRWRPAATAAAASSTSSPPEPHLRDHQQAQAEAAGRRGARQRLGRPAHAHLVGLRRRGYTPERHPQLMAERIGVSKTDSWIDYAVLDDRAARRPGRQGAARDGGARPGASWCSPTGPRCSAPASHREPCSAPVHPQRPELGQRHFTLGAEVWIERDDFAEVPPKGFFRLFPGNKVRLKYGYVIECTGCEKDADGRVTAVLAAWCPTPRAARRAPTRSRSRAPSPGSACARRRAPPTCACTTACSPKPQPDAGGRDFLQALNPNSLTVVHGVGRALAGRAPRPTSASSSSATATSSPTASITERGSPVFNRITGLKDSWVK